MAHPLPNNYISNNRTTQLQFQDAPLFILSCFAIYIYGAHPLHEVPIITLITQKPHQLFLRNAPNLQIYHRQPSIIELIRSNDAYNVNFNAEFKQTFEEVWCITDICISYDFYVSLFRQWSIRLSVFYPLTCSLSMLSQTIYGDLWMISLHHYRLMVCLFSVEFLFKKMTTFCSRPNLYNFVIQFYTFIISRSKLQHRFLNGERYSLTKKSDIRRWTPAGQPVVWICNDDEIHGRKLAKENENFAIQYVHYKEMTKGRGFR